MMIVAMATYAAWSALEQFGYPKPHHLLLTVEWLCLWSFGVAWLVKGQELFRDVAVSRSVSIRESSVMDISER